MKDATKIILTVLTAAVVAALAILLVRPPQSGIGSGDTRPEAVSAAGTDVQPE